MRESASTDLREPQGSNPLGPPGPELHMVSPELHAAWRKERAAAVVPTVPAASEGVTHLVRHLWAEEGGRRRP